jgi:hypothetical protein
MFALASDSKSVISINISLEVIPANNDITRYINGLFLIICKESPFPPFMVLNTSHAANPLVIGLIATNAAQLQFLINVRGFKCTVYKYVTIAPLNTMRRGNTPGTKADDSSNIAYRYESNVLVILKGNNPCANG